MSSNMKKYIVTGLVALVAVAVANRVPQMRKLLRN